MRNLILSIVLFLISTPFMLTKAQPFDRAIDSLNELFIRHDLMGISIVVVADGEPLFEYYNGYKDYENSLIVNEHTAYRIASISKNITAICAMRIVEEGLIDLDSDINQYLPFTIRNPNFPEAPITLRMLLSHRSSIIDGPTYSEFLNATYTSDLPPSIGEFLEPDGQFFNSQTFNAIEPGTYFNYSNINYGIVASALEAVSGQRFDSLCHYYVFDALQIDGGYHPSYLSAIENLATLYRKIDGVWVPQWDQYSDNNPPEISISESYIPGTNGLYFAPQGGIRLSAKHLAKIMVVHQNNGQSAHSEFELAADLQNAMESPNWVYNGQNGNNYWGLFNSWGLGTHITTQIEGGDNVLNGLNMYGHPGEAYGLISGMYYEKEEKIGLVYLINGSGAGYSINDQSSFYSIERELFDIILEEVIDSWRLSTHSGHTDIFESGLLTIFPCPADSFIHLDPIYEDGKTFHIVDPLGKIVKSGRLEGTSIDISYLPPGTYSVNILNEKKHLVASGRWVKS